MDLIELMLLGLLVVCGISTCVSRNLLVSLVIFMAYSIIIPWCGCCSRPRTWPSPRPPWARGFPACCCF